MADIGVLTQNRYVILAESFRPCEPCHQAIVDLGTHITCKICSIQQFLQLHTSPLASQTRYPSPGELSLFCHF